jgi:DNA-binding transcriptional ArsR family regulator
MHEIAALMGDRARSAMLMALMAGQALTATELARAAGVTKQTASAHLARLRRARLIDVEVQGRHHYYRLAGRDIARLLEQLIGVAGRSGTAVRTGPADPAMRRARVCYDHLAGEFGVMVHDSLIGRRLLRVTEDGLDVTGEGAMVLGRIGIDVAALAGGRRPVCLPCLDWSVRRHHLAGSLGSALLERCLELRWARRQRGSRILHFSAVGERALRSAFPAGRPRGTAPA